jgi:hypothetical protein
MTFQPMQAADCLKPYEKADYFKIKNEDFELSYDIGRLLAKGRNDVRVVTNKKSAK